MTPKLSVVSSFYRSREHLEEFVSRMDAAARSLTDSYELLLVDDGSPDDSLAIARRLLEERPSLRVLELAENVGQHRAMLAGTRASRGELVLWIDCDLEEPPELLAELWAVKLREPALDLVLGIQRRRKGRAFERVAGALYYRLLGLLSPVDVAANTTMARLMSRSFADTVLALRDRSLNVDVLTSLAGGTQRRVPVHKGSRGATSYTLAKRVTLLLDGLLGAARAGGWLGARHRPASGAPEVKGLHLPRLREESPE